MNVITIHQNITYIILFRCIIKNGNPHVDYNIKKWRTISSEQYKIVSRCVTIFLYNFKHLHIVKFKKICLLKIFCFKLMKPVVLIRLSDPSNAKRVLI